METESQKQKEANPSARNVTKVLAWLRENNAGTPSYISRYVHVDHRTVKRCLIYLEEQGNVELIRSHRNIMARIIKAPEGTPGAHTREKINEAITTTA